ncbi:hypothetical protein [Acidovorax sp. BoFeN1]|nr:hypothetical protein [Acidovorax sp. BoFeN1]
MSGLKDFESQRKCIELDKFEAFVAMDARASTVPRLGRAAR